MNEGYGKLFRTMYSGSMYGAGLRVMALWPWVIAHKDENGFVEINPQLVADQLGCTAQDVHEAIDYFMQPDPESRTPEHEGRRLVQLSQFSYRVVNHEKYCDRGRDRTAYWRAYRRRKKRAQVAQPSAPLRATERTHVDGNGNSRRPSVSSSQDALRLSDLLLSLIRERKPDFRPKAYASWPRHIDLMIRRDKRAPEVIEGVIRWVQRDTTPRGPSHFCWANVVLCTAKLRQQFDQLQLKMQEVTNGRPKQRQPLTEQDYGALFDPEKGTDNTGVVPDSRHGPGRKIG